MAQDPLKTPLLKQMRRFRRDSGRPWILVDGLEIAAEQAIAQFELMTGRKAPRRLMRTELITNYLAEEGSYGERTIQNRLERINYMGH